MIFRFLALPRIFLRFLTLSVQILALSSFWQSAKLLIFTNLFQIGDSRESALEIIYHYLSVLLLFYVFFPGKEIGYRLEREKEKKTKYILKQKHKCKLH